MPKGTRVHRCVDKVKKSGSKVNPYAVCQASTKQSFATGKKLEELFRKKPGKDLDKPIKQRPDEKSSLKNLWGQGAESKAQHRRHEFQYHASTNKPTAKDTTLQTGRIPVPRSKHQLRLVTGTEYKRLGIALAETMGLVDEGKIIRGIKKAGSWLNKKLGIFASDEESEKLAHTDRVLKRRYSTHEFKGKPNQTETQAQYNAKKEKNRMNNSISYNNSYVTKLMEEASIDEGVRASARAIKSLWNKRKEDKEAARKAEEEADNAASVAKGREMGQQTADEIKVATKKKVDKDRADNRILSQDEEVIAYTQLAYHIDELLGTIGTGLVVGAASVVGGAAAKRAMKKRKSKELAAQAKNAEVQEEGAHKKLVLALTALSPVAMAQKTKAGRAGLSVVKKGARAFGGPVGKLAASATDATERLRRD